MKEKKIIKNLLICGGSPTIEGHRLTPYDVLSSLIYESTIDKIQEYANDHSLSINTIKNALDYCSTQRCKNGLQFNFCDGCVLREEYDKTLSIEGQANMENNWGNKDKISIDDFENYTEEGLGVPGWLVSKNLLNNFFYK